MLWFIFSITTSLEQLLLILLGKSDAHGDVMGTRVCGRPPVPRHNPHANLAVMSEVTSLRLRQAGTQL